MERQGNSPARQQPSDLSLTLSADAGEMWMNVPATLPAGRQEWRDRQAQTMATGLPRPGYRALIRVLEAKGLPVPAAEVSFLSERELYSDCARTDAQGNAVLTVAPCGGDALLVEAAGFASCLLSAPDLVALLPAAPVANTVTLRPLRDHGAGSVVDAPCWGLEAMQIDGATLAMPLGTRRARVAIVGAADPGTAPGTASPDMLAICQIVDRICVDTDTVCHALPSSPSLSQTIAALGALAESGVDLIVLAVLPTGIAPQLEHCIGQLRRKGILVLSPAPDSCRGAGCWSRTAPVLCVGALRRRARKIEPCPLPDLARVDLLAPGAGILVGASLRSGAMLAAAHVAGFLVCLMQVEGLLVGRRQRPVVEALLCRLDRRIRPVASSRVGIPVWGGQEFHAIAE